MAPKNCAPTKNCARWGVTVAIIETKTNAFALRSGSPAARATKSGRATFSIASWYLPPAPYEPSTRRSSMKSEV